SLQGFFITPYFIASNTSVSYGSNFIKSSIFPSLQFLQEGAAFKSPQVSKACFDIAKMIASTGDVRSEKLFALMADYLMAYPNEMDSNTESQFFKTCTHSAPDRNLILEKNKALMNSSHEGLRAMGINIFISMASPTEIPVLIDFLKAESKPEFQATLINRLQKITKDDSSNAVEQLATLMKTETSPNIIEIVVSLLKDTPGSLNVLADTLLRVSSGEYSSGLKETVLNGLMYRINKVKDNYKNNLENDTRVRFIPLLKEEDPNLQLEILKIFAKDKSPVLVPALIQYLESPDKIHQELCEEVFLSITPGEESRKLLQSKMTSSPNSHIRDLAARSFHKISIHPDIAFWVKLASEEKDAKVKETLMEHLSSFKIDGAFYDQISPIFLSTTRPQVQEVLLPFISQFGFQGFKNILLAHQALEKKILGKSLGGKNQKSATTSPDASSPDSSSSSPSGTDEGTMSESSSSRQDLSQRVFSQCQATLLKMSQKLQEEHFKKKSITSEDIPPLMQALSLPSLPLRQNVLNILKQAKSSDLAKRPMSEYFDSLEKNNFPQLNELYSELISKAANSSHHEYLLEKLNESPSKVVQVIAVKALKNSETPLAFPTLFKVLEENDDSVFTQSVMDSVKAHSKQPEAFPVLVDKLMGSGDPKIQILCAQALAEHHFKTSFPSFSQFYQTRYPALSASDKKSVDKAFVRVLENTKSLSSKGKETGNLEFFQSLIKLLSLETSQEVYESILSSISSCRNSDSELSTPGFVSTIFDSVAQHYAQGRTFDNPSLVILNGILQNTFETALSDKTPQPSNGSKKFYQTLMTQFNSPEPTVRMLAAQCLPQFLKQISLKEILKLMDSEKSPEVLESLSKSLEFHPAVKSGEDFTTLAQAFLSPKTSIFLSQKVLKILKGKFESELKFRFLVIDKLNQVLHGKVESVDIEDPTALQQFQVFQTGLMPYLKSIISSPYDASLFQKDTDKRTHSTVEALLKLPSEEFNKIALAHLSRLDLVNSEADYTTAVSCLFDYLDSSSCLLPQQGIGALFELSKSNNSKFKAILSRLAMEKLITPKSSALSKLAAVKSLETSLSGEDLPLLFRVLEGSQDQPLQEVVVKVIEKIGRKPETFSFLTLMLRESGTIQSKIACARALEGHGDEALTYLYPALAQLSESEEHLPLVQSIEKSIAQNTMTEASAPVLLENLKSPHTASKRMALLTTGTLIEKWKQRGDYSNQGIVGFLTKLKESADKTLQQQAEKALNEMIERKIAELEKIVPETKLSFEDHQAITQLCVNAPSQRVKDAANNATGRMMAQISQ
ncbi:MAG: HEAT repeat domain-containing protein, partial [Cyanobacteria bacterium]|nr:HEAT repeat domain-containing protein [Cyanobacteriota bacterium]